MKGKLNGYTARDLYERLVAKNWKVNDVARDLGVNRTCLYRKMKKLRIRIPSMREPVTYSKLILLMEMRNRNVARIAEETGHTKGHIWQLLKRWNIPKAETWQKKSAQTTHCKKGHEFNEKNTYIAKTGYRICRKCQSINSLKLYHERRIRDGKPVRNKSNAASLPNLSPATSAEQPVQVRRDCEVDPHATREHQLTHNDQQGSSGHGVHVPTTAKGLDSTDRALSGY